MAIPSSVSAANPAPASKVNAEPIAFNTPSGMKTNRGYGDTEVGVKWQLNEETNAMPMVHAPTIRFAHAPRGIRRDRPHDHPPRQLRSVHRPDG